MESLLSKSLTPQLLTMVWANSSMAFNLYHLRSDIINPLAPIGRYFCFVAYWLYGLLWQKGSTPLSLSDAVVVVALNVVLWKLSSLQNICFSSLFIIFLSDLFWSQEWRCTFWNSLILSVRVSFTINILMCLQIPNIGLSHFTKSILILLVSK